MTNEEFFSQIGKVLLEKSLKGEVIEVECARLYLVFQKLEVVMYDLFEAEEPSVDGAKMRSFLNETLSMMSSGMSSEELKSN